MRNKMYWKSEKIDKNAIHNLGNGASPVNILLQNNLLMYCMAT